MQEDISLMAIFTLWIQADLDTNCFQQTAFLQRWSLFNTFKGLHYTSVLKAGIIAT